MADNQDVFTKIYENQVWNDGRSDIPLSGPGSSLANAAACSTALEVFVYENDCESVLDLGCGDLTWISKTRFFNDPSVKYSGIDIVESLITSHRANYPNNTFICKDLIDYSDFEPASIVVIRDVIFHLTNQQINLIFNNLKNKFKFIMITSCNNSVNSDSFDRYHFAPKNVHKEPFCKSRRFRVRLSEPVFDREVLIYEHDAFYE